MRVAVESACWPLAPHQGDQPRSDSFSGGTDRQLVTPRHVVALANGRWRLTSMALLRGDEVGRLVVYPAALTACLTPLACHGREVELPQTESIVQEYPTLLIRTVSAVCPAVLNLPSSR